MIKEIPTIGTRPAVMHGNALKTSGGLMKKDLKYNKQGRIVSKKKSMQAKKDNRLEKAGWHVKKGEFGSFQKDKKSPKKSKKK